MKVYIDLIFFINFSFDFLILLTVGIILKRKVKLIRILLGSLVGGLSIFLLFIRLNSISLFFLKVIISILMILISFNYKDRNYFIKNIVTLYFISIILGGFLYYLNNQFSLKNNGLVFINNGFSINYILLVIISPIILYFYIKQVKELRINNNFYYDVSFIYKNKKYNYKGFIDTGNKLYDPYLNLPVILLHDYKINIDNPIYIPYHNINGNGIIKAFKINSILLNNNKVNKKIIVGLVDDKFNIDGISILLHSDLL